MAGTMRASVIVELLDKASAPARQIAASLRGISGAAASASGKGFSSFSEGITANAKASTQALTAMRSKMLEAVAAGYALKQSLAGTTGVASDFESTMLDIGQKADMPDAAMKALANRIRSLAPTINQTAGEAAKSMDTLMGLGLDQDRSEKALTPIGRTAAAYKADLEEVSKAAFSVIDNLKVAPEQLGRALDAMSQSGKEGAFEIKDMAREFPSLTAAAQALKMTGVDAVSKLSAALQIARKGAATGSEAATNTANLMQKIISPETTKKFKKAGVDIRAELKKTQDSGGDIFEMIAAQVTKVTKGDLGKIGDFFQDSEVQKFLRPLIQNLAEYRRIRDLAKGSNGVVDKDFLRRMQTAEARTKAFNAGLNALGLSIGTILLPSLNDLTGNLLSITRGAEAFTEAHPALVSGAVKIAASLVALKVATMAAAFGYSALKGGAMAGMAAVAATQSGLKRAAVGMLALLTPIKLVGAAMRGLRLAAMSTGVGAALVAIGTAGAFIYRNWQGAGKAFTSFSAAFQKGLSPDAAKNLQPLFDAGKRVSAFFDDLTGKIDDEKWSSWGKSLGESTSKLLGDMQGIAAAIGGVVKGLETIGSWFTGAGDLVANTKREFEAFAGAFAKIKSLITGEPAEAAPAGPAPLGKTTWQDPPARPGPKIPMPDNKMLPTVLAPVPPLRPLEFGKRPLLPNAPASEPPARPTGLDGRATPSPAPEASKIAEATAALATYKAELAGINQQLTGLQASGEGAFSPELPSLEGRKAELEGLVSGTKAKLDELNAVTVAPKGDGSGLAPLGTAADEAKGKLSELGSISVTPTVNPASIQAANAQTLQLLANLAKVGPAVTSAQSQVASLNSSIAGVNASAGARPASPSSRARTDLAMGKENAQNYNPVG